MSGDVDRERERAEYTECAELTERHSAEMAKLKATHAKEIEAVRALCAEKDIALRELANAKRRLTSETNAQMEQMRDALEDMRRQFMRAQRQLASRRHREGYVAEEVKSEKEEAEAEAVVSRVTFGRSRHSAHSVAEAVKAHVRLAQATAQEMNRLRGIIKAMARAQTKSASVGVEAVDPGS